MDIAFERMPPVPGPFSGKAGLLLFFELKILAKWPYARLTILCAESTYSKLIEVLVRQGTHLKLPSVGMELGFDFRGSLLGLEVIFKTVTFDHVTY